METNLMPLHSFPQYTNECAEILNEEWKRSLTARLQTLQKSRDSFPVNLVLLEAKSREENIVVGHSRLSVVQGQSMPSCLVESVVVRKSLRGKGYGKVLMQKTENFAAKKGYEIMFLTTHDKQKFYGHIGYEFCSPVISMGTDILPEHLALKLMGNLTVQNNYTPTSHDKRTSAGMTTICDTSCDLSQTGSKDNRPSTQGAEPNVLTPPTPPPPPPKAGLSNIAPPPPPAVKSTSINKSDISRFDPRNVSWMKKCIANKRS